MAVSSDAAGLEIKRVKRAGDDYYSILNLSKGAGDDEIKKAYRKLALRLHPDKCQEDGAEEAFKRVGEAFSVLSDEQKRKRYDQFGIDGVRDGGGGGPGHNAEDIFEAFFGGGGMGGPGGVQFMRAGGGQTFQFSSGGPGVFHFSSGGGGFGGGSPFGPGGPRVQQRRPQPAQEPVESPAWMKHMQMLAGALGPMLPLVVVGLFFLGLVFVGSVMQFMLSRAFIVFPILYLTEGRTKVFLLLSVVILAGVGVL